MQNREIMGQLGQLGQIGKTKVLKDCVAGIGSFSLVTPEKGKRAGHSEHDHRIREFG